MDRLLRVPEVAELLACSTSNIYAAVAAGVLPAYRVGVGRGGLRFSMEQIEEYLGRRETTKVKPEPTNSSARAPVTPPFRHLKL